MYLITGVFAPFCHLTRDLSRGSTKQITALISRCLLTLLLGCTCAFSMADTYTQTSVDKKVLLVLGDSLSAGYGINIDQGWVSLLQKRLDQANYNYHVVNASISGETTGGGLRRLPQALDRWSPDIVVVELGGNDGLRGIAPKIIASNLKRMIELNQQAGAQSLLLGMQIPPNYGPRYTRQFHQNYRDIASAYEIPLVPFFLDGVATDRNKMQADGIHPKANAQPQMLEHVWEELQPMLEAKVGAR